MHTYSMFPRLASGLLILCAAGVMHAADTSSEPANAPAPPPERCLIIAHRGASYDAPENTTESAVLAWQQNADALEFDIYLTADNRIVGLHDRDTSRTSGGTKLVPHKTKAEKLRKLDVGTFKHPRYAGTRIPFIDELMETVPPGKGVFIEIKCGPEIVPHLEKALRESGKMEQCSIICFNMETLCAAKKAMPKLPMYYLQGTPKDKKTSEPLPFDAAALTRQVKEAGLDGLDLQNTGIDDAVAAGIRKSGMGFYAWTVDDPKEAVRLKRLGVMGITTNRPALIRQHLEDTRD